MIYKKYKIFKDFNKFDYIDSKAIKVSFHKTLINKLNRCYKECKL